MKSFGFTQIREGIGSTHRGIVGTYTTNFRVINTSPEVEYGYQRRGYNLPKAEDTIYQRHYVSGKELTRILVVKDTVG